MTLNSTFEIREAKLSTDIDRHSRLSRSRNTGRV